MTSSGFRFPARALTGLAIIAITAASVLPAADVRAQPVFASRRPSARIYALGSGFAGIIPDQLTDLTLNPAHAWDARSLTINYGFRNQSSHSLPFPVADSELKLDFYSSSTSAKSNELRLFGVGAWGWKWAFDTEWRLLHKDVCDPPGGNPVYRDWGGDLRFNVLERCTINDDNFFRLDISSARRIGDRSVLGLRAGGTYRYYNYRQRRRNSSREYYLDGGTGQYTEDISWSDDRMQSDEMKLFSGYLEAGMTWKDSGELVLRGGYAEGTRIQDDYDLEIDADYDRDTGDIEDYRYHLDEFYDDRIGDTWCLSAFVKKRYSGGIVILAAGAYERGNYESGWRDAFTMYTWGRFDDGQVEDLLLYPGEGIRTRSEATFKIGRTFALERRIDLTPGAHISYARQRFEESGDASISSSVIVNDVPSSAEYLAPVSFERTESYTRLALPLAIEFRPASFFHLYSGFGMTFTWNRDSRMNTFLLPYGQPDELPVPSEITTDDNSFASSYYATLGFSLRYRERLFFDMYTGNDIVPDYISKYFIDLRYVF